MPSQVVYQTNADWHATYEALVNNSLVRADTTQKGLIQFWFKDSPTLFMLSPMGKLQVKWNNVEEKKILFGLVKNLIVAAPNEELVIKPLKQQLWIDYPVPDSFKVYWCGDTSEFVLKKPVVGLSKSHCDLEREKRIAAMSAEIGKVKKAVDELKHEFRFFREPTPNEVALKSGCLDSQIIRLGLLFAGWKEGQSIEEAKWTAEEAINLATWLRFNESGELNPQLIASSKKAIDKASMSAIAKAQVILKNYPELVPRINAGKLEWPDETKNKWMQVFGSEPPAP